MRKGRFNKPELARLARIYTDLDKLLGELPHHTKCDKDELCTGDKLRDARLAVADLLRWQDFALFQSIRKPTTNA